MKMSIMSTVSKKLLIMAAVYLSQLKKLKVRDNEGQLR